MSALFSFAVEILQGRGEDRSFTENIWLVGTTGARRNKLWGTNFLYLWVAQHPRQRLDFTETQHNWREK